MDQNRGNNPNNGKKPEGERPKGSYFTPLMIALILVLLFSWIMNTVEKSQYTETNLSEFFEAKDSGQLAEVELRYDRILYMTKEEAAKDPARQKAAVPVSGGTVNSGRVCGDHSPLALRAHINTEVP